MRLQAVGLAICAVGLPGQVAALPLCDALWLSRNAILDQAGQCFETPLGQAVFDNAGCGDVEFLLPGASRAVAALSDMEGANDCAVDTQSTASATEMQAVLAAFAGLTVIPIREGEESACIGYADRIFLRAGTGSEQPLAGEVLPGQTILFSHVPLADYEFVEVFEDGAQVSRGWMANSFFDHRDCADIAG